MVLDTREMMLRARIHPIFWFWSWDFVVGSVRQAIAVGGWALRAGGRLAGDLRLRGHGLATQGEGCRAAERQRMLRRGARARGHRGPRPRQGGRARAQGHGASGPRRGRRVIGQAALTGTHRWILQDSLDDWGEADEVLLEMKDQFCAGIQVMEEAALIDHVRSLFGQLGSSTAVVPHDPFLQDPIMKTIVCNSLDMPNSSHLIDLPGSVNTSSPNDDRISHHFRHQMSPASMIQPFHSVQQFYARATFCCPVTRASCCDFFQPLVQSDHTSIFLLNSQSEGKKSTAEGSI